MLPDPCYLTLPSRTCCRRNVSTLLQLLCIELLLVWPSSSGQYTFGTSYSHCFPQGLDSCNQFILWCGLDFSSNVLLEFMPQISNGFKSGDSGGVGHQLISLSSKKLHASFEQCFGSLSCTKRWSSGTISLINGSSEDLKIETNNGDNVATTGRRRWTS